MNWFHKKAVSDGVTLTTIQGDITHQKVDVIVNAANSALLGGGGVDGAIHAGAGPSLLAACQNLRASSLPDGLPAGQAVATPAGKLNATWVIHTVGPNKGAGENDPVVLASCFTESLNAAEGLGATSIAFPAISAGIYGWDIGEVATVAVSAVCEWVQRHPDANIRSIRFVLFDKVAQQVFASALEGHSRKP
jgi:O-acetyl-ADP-ribose deacetylase